MNSMSRSALPLCSVKNPLDGAWATMDDDMLDAALAKFHKDWGGEGTAMEIDEELRGSRENSRTIETW